MYSNKAKYKLGLKLCHLVLRPSLDTVLGEVGTDLSSRLCRVPLWVFCLVFCLPVTVCQLQFVCV